MLDISNPLHLAIGTGESARGYFHFRATRGGPNSRQLRKWHQGLEDVYGDHSPLWPFLPHRRPTDAQITTFKASKRLHRRPGHFFYQFDMLVEDQDTGSYEWRLWGVSYRGPVTFRRAQRDAIRTFDAQVAGKPGTNLRVVAAIPLEVRRFGAYE